MVLTKDSGLSKTHSLLRIYQVGKDSSLMETLHLLPILPQLPLAFFLFGTWKFSIPRHYPWPGFLFSQAHSCLAFCPLITNPHTEQSLSTGSVLCHKDTGKIRPASSFVDLTSHWEVTARWCRPCNSLRIHEHTESGTGNILLEVFGKETWKHGT